MKYSAILIFLFIACGEDSSSTNTMMNDGDDSTSSTMMLDEQDDSSTEDQDNQGGYATPDMMMNQAIDTPVSVSKSFKRGIASALMSEADFIALAPGIAWWYNWSPSYNRAVRNLYEDYDMDWVPMTWNGNNPDEIRAFLNQHPKVKYLLTFNEPNFQDQANMTPAYAASIWPTFEEIAEEYNVKLVGPAVNYCGGCVVVDGTPIESNFTIWMDMFLDEYRTQFNREPHIDFMALHWYDFGLEDQINEMVIRYDKPVWLTEFALWRGEDWNTDEFERDWMLDMVAYLEEHPMVYRYAWFTARRPDFPKINLLAEDGVLTPLGQAYIDAPF